MAPEPDRDEIRLAIEAVHHACLAGDADDAAAIFYNRVYQGPRAVLTRVLGNIEAALDSLTEFFPGGDLSADPTPRNEQARRWILHEVAACLHLLGRLAEAGAVGARAAAAAMRQGDRHNAALSYHNLAETYLASGALTSCRDVAENALALSTEAAEREDELVASTVLGTLDDLSGRPEQAGRRFDRALTIAVEDTSVPILYSLSGIRYADHLRLTGSADEALAVEESNLEFCELQGWESDVARILAKIAVTNPSVDAYEMCTRAVRIARTLGAEQVLAETLLARVDVLIRLGRWDDAETDVTEALVLVQASRYGLLEVDARLRSATVRTRRGDLALGRADAQLAEMSAGVLGYELGRRAAGVLLASLP